MILDGAKVAQKIRNELKEKISKEKRAPSRFRNVGPK